MSITEQAYASAAERLQCEVAVVKAVAAVESSGTGFDPERFPKTLFEGHIFSKLTGRRFDADHPTLSYAKWTSRHYGKTWRAEKARLASACQLDRDAALKSASWGLFQIMGFNHALCGFESVQQFVNAMCKDEDAHLHAFVEFIRSTQLAECLREKRWAEFARRYNGPQYAKNKHDTKLELAYRDAST